MRVPYSELNKYIKVEDIDPKELVERLNTHSVEATLDFFGNSNVEKVVVAKILKTEPHPTLKKLLVCEVDIGTQKVVICTNDKTVKEGDKVFAVLPGGRIGDLKIGERNFKGIVSKGMFLGLEELVGVSSEGVFKFHDPNVEPGTDVKKLLGLGEPIIELDITPNRGDLLSVKGLAREIAALYNRPISLPEAPRLDIFGSDAEIEILDNDCGRYRGAVVRNVNVGESSLWLMVALWKFGEAVINNVVDITNYLLFTEGNPMHAFDLDKIEGKIYVRSANEGETFKALNGKEYKLSTEDLVIADDKKVLALAGVIGGADSGVSEKTENILLETAYFNPYRVRKSAKRHDIRTESSYRFERNVDIENIERSQNLAVKLIRDLAGGEVSTVRDVYPNPYRPKEVSLSFRKLVEYTGGYIEPKKVFQILNSLGLPTEVEIEEESLKRAILKFLVQKMGCEGFRLLYKEDKVDAYIICDGKEIPVKFGDVENFEGIVINYTGKGEKIDIDIKGI